MLDSTLCAGLQFKWRYIVETAMQPTLIQYNEERAHLTTMMTIMMIVIFFFVI